MTTTQTPPQTHQPAPAQPGSLPYPSGVLRLMLRLPLWLYRLGLGPLVGLIPFMVITTRGRRSGLPRHAILEYRQHGRKIYVVSGWGTHPNWYQNLLANPIVTLQTGGEELRARAVPIRDAQEALRALYMFRRRSPLYARLFARMSSAERIDLDTLVDVSAEFTVVRFDVLPEEPADDLPGVPPSHAWITALVSLGLAVMALWRWIAGRRAVRTPVSEPQAEV